MKRKIIGLLAIVALFALAIAAYAYTSVNTAVTNASCCCSKKEGDSCPMKKKGHDAQNGEHAKTEGEHSCCGCCGDSCPMKKGVTAVLSVTDGKSCCDDCDCCKGKKEDSAT